MTTYTIEKGDHFSTPRCPKFLLRSITGSAQFIKGSYDLQGVDQFDWNKLTGISFNPIIPNKNAIMIGWRWNIAARKMEYCAYFNLNGSNITPETKPSAILSVEENEAINFNITYDKVVIWSEKSKISIDVPKNMPKSYWTSFRIQPYFGGNRTTTSKIILKLNN